MTPVEQDGGGRTFAEECAELSRLMTEFCEAAFVKPVTPILKWLTRVVIKVQRL